MRVLTRQMQDIRLNVSGIAGAAAASNIRTCFAYVRLNVSGIAGAAAVQVEKSADAAQNRLNVSGIAGAAAAF